MNPHAGIMGTVDPPVLPPARINRPCHGWIVDPWDLSGTRLRCLGVVGQVVEVEWSNRPGKPTGWLALDDFRLASVAREVRRREQL